MPRRLLVLLVLGLAAPLLLARPAEWPARAAAAAALEAGFGEADITPKVDKKKPVYIAGFGRNRVATGVHDPLRARAVVLRHGEHKVALVSVDLVGLFLPDVERARAGLPGFRYVLVSSTHNHEGPDTLGLWGPTLFESGVDRAYLAFVVKQIVKAVQAADADRKPVTARIGTAQAPELLHDGRLPIVKHDELVALAFRDAKADKHVGLLVQWNCHPEALGAKNTLLSSDYVGATVKHLSDKYRCPVVYLTGTVGGLMTSLKVPVKDKAGKALEDGTFEKNQRYGELVGELAEKALKAAKPLRLTPFTVRQRPLYLPLANRVYVAAQQLGVLERQAYLWQGDSSKGVPVKKVDPKKAHAVRTEIGYLRLGELEVAAIPGEIYPELVLDKVVDPAEPGADFPDAPIEPAIYKQLKGPHRMIVGLANDEIGYIIPKRQWDEKPPFCYGRKSAQYGEVNSLGPETAPLLCAAFKGLVAGKK
jgi:hypothetical protein